VATDRQEHNKHVFAATTKHTPIKELLEAVLSVQSMLRLYSKDQQEKLGSQRSRSQLGVCSCINSSCYLTMTSEKTRDFMCAVVVVIYRAQISQSVIVISNYSNKRSIIPAIYPNPMSSHKHTTIGVRSGTVLNCSTYFIVHF
jgi:hypothetical protein